MTTDDRPSPETLEKLNANLAKLDELSKRLVAALSRKKPVEPALQGPSSELFMKAAAAYVAGMMTNPAKILEHQVSYWGKSLKHYLEAQQRLMQGRLEVEEEEEDEALRRREDRRFQGELWHKHPYFNYLRQQYLLNAEAVENAIADMQGLDAKERKRVEYFTHQILEMFNPANFLGTNPEALQRAIETEGESLVRGLENLVRDIEENEGDLLVTLADKNAFRVGENLATTDGEVVYRNRLFELIQYTPRTETVHKTPLIIFPPWINKFYILDLKPQNSLIRWIVEQGYTLFVVSWKNPDPSYADVGLDTYIEEGYLTAIREVKAITGEEQINAVGYCIAGTTLALTLALMHKRGDKSIRSATFFTTLTDFEDQGEFAVFLTDDFVDGIEREVEQRGILRSFFMARTFSFLRSNDLVYAPAIRSYMLGETPPAFDLLYWNGDGTNLPARMTVEYLRWLCQQNRFAKGELEILGEKLSIRDVRVPLCAVACETDHIAPWKASYNGIRQMGSRSKMFILSESGHIAGIVNPPSKNKYGHYLNPEHHETPEEWLEHAQFHEGSWWPDWEAWLAKRSGRMIPARQPGDENHPSLGKAPGSYVLVRADEVAG
ncbi:MAG: class I poly(R)-hydroxyalkanoic acid synthase [Alphaproteobacteria bacterium]|nr:MAG: class I poly(R)-hydroxyalkanoic acid synthase [Alphaproteobacteria bacterium]